MVRNDDFKLRTDTWQEMIVALADKGYEVDSAYQRSPEKHILAYKDGDTYSIEVTQYFKGDYEVLSDNIHIDDYTDVESATDVSLWRKVVENVLSKLEKTYGFEFSGPDIQEDSVEFMYGIPDEGDTVFYIDREMSDLFDRIDSGDARGASRILRREILDNYEQDYGPVEKISSSTSTCNVPVVADRLPDGTEYDPEDFAGGYTEWTEIRSKSVRDYDGFMTDYTLWYNEFTGMYVCIFGDKDIYYPENADPDMEFESEDEAIEWFDNYDEDTLFESTQVDECQDIKAGTDKVTLTIQYYPYERHISTPLTRAKVSGPNLLEALKNLVDKVGMYLDREQIEDEEMSPEDIIQYLMMVNGDGCDYITELKNASTGEILIEAEDFDEEEDWDD